MTPAANKTLDTNADSASLRRHRSAFRSAAQARPPMKALIRITSLLVATCCHGAELLGVPVFEPVPIAADLHSPDWHPPLLPPELLPPQTNLTPVARASSHPLNGPAATLLGVYRSADKSSLMVQYDLSGRTNELQIVLTNGIAEFHFCSWVRGRGIALALSDEDGAVYWAASYAVAGRAGPIYPRRLPSPWLFITRHRQQQGRLDHHHRRRTRERARSCLWLDVLQWLSSGYESFQPIPTNQIQVSGLEHLVMFETTPKTQK